MHEPPVKVSLPNLTSFFRPAVWRRLDSDVNGEWGFYLILDQFLKSSAESKRAAAGWGGDHYEVYENRRGQVVYVSVSAWDTERDAREFFDAYVARTRLRYSDTVTAAVNDSWSAQTSEGNVLIQLRGKQVVAVEGLPDSRTTRAITNRILGAE